VTDSNSNTHTHIISPPLSERGLIGIKKRHLFHVDDHLKERTERERGKRGKRLGGNENGKMKREREIRNRKRETDKQIVGKKREKRYKKETELEKYKYYGRERIKRNR